MSVLSLRLKSVTKKKRPSPPPPHTATPTTKKNTSGTQEMDNRRGSHTSQTRAIEATGHLYSSPSSLRSRKQNGTLALFFSRGKRGFCCPSLNANLLPRKACHFPGCEKTTINKGSKDASPTHWRGEEGGEEGRGGRRRGGREGFEDIGCGVATESAIPLHLLRGCFFDVRFPFFYCNV